MNSETANLKTLADFEAYAHKNRSRDMLTVKDLIAYLQTQDPDACVVAYETNSNAYIEQFKELPNACVRTIAEDKVAEREQLKQWYRGYTEEQIAEKTEAHMKEVYRYCEDSDVVIRF